MDGGEESSKSREKRPGRGWTQRFSGPIRYRRFVDLDGGGNRYIFFQFDLPAGEKALPPEVYEILAELKHMKPRPGHGMKPQHSGLQFNRDRQHGRVWKIPDTPTGRTAADIIDAKLSDVAERLEMRGNGK